MSTSGENEGQTIRDLERMVVGLKRAVQHQSKRIASMEVELAAKAPSSAPCPEDVDAERYPPHWLHIKINSTATDADVSVTRHPPDGVEIKIGRATDIIQKLQALLQG